MAVTLEATTEAAVKPAEIVLDPEKSYEIVNGQPEEKEMPGARHAVIGGRLVVRLGGFVESHNLGVVCTEANFKIGENERIPDVSFVAAARIPAEEIPESIWPVPPDLAIEIISPSDLHDKVSEKVLEYLEAGVRQVWLISSKLRSITIFRSPTEIQVFTGDSELASEDLLPGFCCSLKEIFQTSLGSSNSK
ncbi:MAG: Uma2 family endonuclease [Blastocatellia bacterium]